MIGKVLRELNRYFPRTVETIDATVADGVTGNFSARYAVGQYVLIRGTILSDGVYKITAVDTNKLTLDATFTPETLGDIEYPRVYGLAIPPEVLGLASDIEAFTESPGVASESLGDYSISYGQGSGSWESAFATKLSAWRAVYPDIKAFDRNYMWQDRW